MRAAAELLQPGLGAWSYDCFDRLNECHFGGELPPLPILWVPVAPYGHWIGLARCRVEERAIFLQGTGATGLSLRPSDRHAHILLHEMVHQYLALRGEPTAHESEAWCCQIMRIGRNFGLHFWASPPKPTRRNNKPVRIQAPSPEGVESVPYKTHIAGFPHGFFSYAPEATLNSYGLQYVAKEEAS